MYRTIGLEWLILLANLELIDAIRSWVEDYRRPVHRVRPTYSSSSFSLQNRVLMCLPPLVLLNWFIVKVTFSLV